MTKALPSVICICLALCGHPAAAAPAVFARLAADREGIYRGEQFRLTLSVFSSGDTLGRQISMSGMPDASVLSLGAFEELPNESSVIDGRVYDVRRYRARARVNIAGTLRLEPQFRGTLVRTSRTYWSTFTQEQPVAITIEPIALDIRDVPVEGRPAAFSGAVGQFSFTAEASPLDVALGDLVTVTMTIAGEGLPDELVPPAVPSGAGLKTYEVRPLPKQNTAERRVFEQTVVAAEPVATAIPSLSFCYFDARHRRFTTLTSGPFPLTFHAERAPTNTVYRPSPTTSGVGVAANPVAAAADPVPSRLAHGWHALTGQRFARTPGDTDIPARFAPNSEALVLFTLHPGSRVRIEGTAEGWVRVSCRHGVGWVPAQAIAPAW